MKSTRLLVALPILALVFSHVIFLPLTLPVFQLYGELNKIQEQMIKEDDSIMCHRVMENTKEARELLEKEANISWSCDDTYYRENAPTVTVNGLTVYKDTYQRYMRVKSELRRKFKQLILIFTLSILVSIAFNYAMSIAFIEAQTRKELSLLGIIGEGFKNTPFLILAYLLNGSLLFVVSLLIAIPIAFAMPIAKVVIGIMLTGGISLVAPIYAGEKKIFSLDVMWNIAKTNSHFFILLGGAVFAVTELQSYSLKDALIWLYFAAILLNTTISNYGGAFVYMSSAENLGV
ncbi:hypothetical protein E3E31_03410 [Thermococcus sp. M39]|uniref:hypothetical protein n=1 Tax=unclassified Thermococcus TaxID=2627626 RepID=UPI00143B265C|nr:MULTISPECIES: hypothetical protein [unclassified Thermococcus]NJE07579.1 hypothetical protein [Thermococcus sp. M39]NJE12163.1 hypothetical protein [Thermococcus sp. LS2]